MRIDVSQTYSSEFPAAFCSPSFVVSPSELSGVRCPLCSTPSSGSSLKSLSLISRANFSACAAYLHLTRTAYPYL